MKIIHIVAATCCLSAGATPACAGTEIDFTVSASNDEFTVATTSNVVSRQYTGSGMIEFSDNPQSGLFNISDVVDFSLNVNWTATLDDGTVLFDNFSYGVTDLSWLYSNFDANSQPRTLNFQTDILPDVSGSPSGIVQKPLSVQVAFDDMDGDTYQASTAFWVYPPPGTDDQVLSAVGDVSGTVSGLPSSGDVSDSMVASNPKAADFALTFASFSSAAPEPSSWAMMVAGFAAIGAANRRRRRVAANHA
jgi:PEP-CTERM motif